jgi:HK97 family phage major capsid protein
MADGTGALPAEIKQAIAAFEKTGAELKQAFDDRAKQGDALLEEKIGKIVTDLDGLKQSVNESIAEMKRSGAGGDDDGYDDEEKSIFWNALQRSAFDTLIRKGDLRDFYADADARKAAEILEMKDLSTVIGQDGGYSIVPERMSEMIEIMLETSPMRDLAAVHTIGTREVEIPVDRKGANALWINELGTRNTTNTPELTKLRISAEEIYALPVVTEAILEDADFDVEEWLQESVREAFEIAENLAFVAGNGVGRPRGFTTHDKVAVASYDANTNWGSHAFRATGAAGAFQPSYPGSPIGSTPATNSAEPMIKLVYDFKKAMRDDLTWAMNRMTLGEVRSLKDGNGQFIVKDHITEDGILTAVLGYPVEEFEDMPDIAADAYAIALGNFAKGYMIVDRIGIQVKRDEITVPGFVRYHFRRRTGGACTNFDAIKFLRFAA